jgi:glycerol-3-phosphate O-acyltransferase
LKVSSCKFKIVPVSINYERIFDESLLASEIISGEFENITALGLFKKIFTMPKNKLGKVFVKYADPIDLDSYVEENKSKYPRFNDMALKLTKDLIV